MQATFPPAPDALISAIRSARCAVSGDKTPLAGRNRGRTRSPDPKPDPQPRPALLASEKVRDVALGLEELLFHLWAAPIPSNEANHSERVYRVPRRQLSLEQSGEPCLVRRDEQLASGANVPAQVCETEGIYVVHGLQGIVKQQKRKGVDLRRPTQSKEVCQRCNIRL